MPTKPQAPQKPPNEDDVLRRMLSTPPKQHDKKPAPGKKRPSK